MYINKGLGSELQFEMNYGCDITFFVPCLDEASNIRSTFDTIQNAVKKTGYSYQILVIDDASEDNSVEVIEDYSANHPGIRIDLIRNNITRGFGRNYVDAAYLGCGKYFMLVCGDNAEPKETIETIISNMGKADMIIPHFGANDRRSRARVHISRFFTRLVNIISNNKVSYYNGPVLHKRINVIRWHSDTYGFAYQAEIITRLLEEGATYLEVVVGNYPRNEGLTKAFRLVNILSVTHSLLQILIRRVRKVIINYL